MNLDATTFALEVLNFLVLVWLLKRFLYKPVVDVIERRRSEDEKTVAAAQALRAQADALKTQYEQRLASAADDRLRALAALDAEVAAERSRRLSALEEELKAERERRQALEARATERHDAERDRRAVRLGAQFATRLVDRLAGPALEDRIVELALADLPALPGDRREVLKQALAAEDAAVEVTSAYPLAPARREALTRALAALAGRPIEPTFAEDTALKAGLRVRAGAWLLKASLDDELAFFEGAVAHEG